MATFFCVTVLMNVLFPAPVTPITAIRTIFCRVHVRFGKHDETMMPTPIEVHAGVHMTNTKLMIMRNLHVFVGKHNVITMPVPIDIHAGAHKTKTMPTAMSAFHVLLVVIFSWRASGGRAYAASFPLSVHCDWSVPAEVRADPGRQKHLLSERMIVNMHTLEKTHQLLENIVPTLMSSCFDRCGLSA